MNIALPPLPKTVTLEKSDSSPKRQQHPVTPTVITKDAKTVSTNPTLNVGIHQKSAWIQVLGKGSFSNSPALKSYCNKQLESGTTQLVIDLGQCTGMDSTFMGTLAGIAMRLAKNPAATFQVADANQRNHDSLEDLGLDCVMEINPAQADWRGNLDSIRQTFQPWEEKTLPNTHLILEAHQKLCDADSSNNEKFDTVINVLKDQISKE